ncbi:hypothetical protein GCM10022419_105950 [Nonomuraea rosea]|uniref:ORC1/DEAH AAA+ ATPase domain-containing protein n=1 Tax=Nonomuraea rosea TaxID=638574 RepID=A0ABP6ZCW1_9ACTN
MAGSYDHDGTAPVVPVHFVPLQDARIVATDHLIRTTAHVRQVLDAKAMMCVYGESGLGKTFSVDAALCELAPDNVHHIVISERAAPPYVRTKLFEAVAGQEPMPRSAAAVDKLLKKALSEQFHVFVCDNAQWLSAEGYSYWQHLWSDRATDIAVIFIGCDGGLPLLDRTSALASSVYLWQRYQALSQAQIREVLPAFHPVWAEADPDDIDLLYQAADGVFRSWAKLTYQILTVMHQQERKRIDREIVHGVLSHYWG